SIVIGALRSGPEHGQWQILVVKTGNDKHRLVFARQVLVSAPLSPDTMHPLGLDRTESQIFDKLRFTYYYATLVADTGLPDQAWYHNVDTGAPYNIPSLPTVYNVATTRMPGLHYAWYGATEPI